LDFLLGYEQYSLDMSGIWGSGRNVYSGYNHTLSNIIDNKELGGEKDYYATRGIFGRVNYNFDNRYFASVSYRRDASSRFARDHRWGNFWSLSAAWDISNEKFFEPISTIVDFLKYKISFGQQGNDQMAQGGVINNYPYIDQYNQGGANGVWSVGTLYFKGNPNLTWETSNSFNTGFDFSLWHGLLSGSLEYFMRQTDDMLFFKPTGLSSGYSSIPMNIGSMRNSGIELDLNIRPVATEKVSWDLNLNLTYIDNKIIKLAPELNGRWQSGSQIFEEGKSRYQLYLVKYAGVDPENGSSLWWGRHADGTEFKTADYNVAYNGDKSTGDVSNRQATGNMLPPVYGGFGTSLQAFGFDFSIQFAYQLGGRILDSGYQELMNGAYQEDKGGALHKDLLNAWTPESPSGSVPRLDWGAKYTGATSDRWMTSSDYLSLNNISLGYTLPKSLTSKIGLASVRIYGAADNVALWSKRKGMDPRQSYVQSYAGYYAALRTISGGIKITY
jgi:TonB-linked SusC/RagA family outer membrane protein